MIRTPSSTVIGGVGVTTQNCLVIGKAKQSLKSYAKNLFKNGSKGLFLLPDLKTDVGNVLDLSGNTNNATQTTASKKPLLQQNPVTKAWYLKFDGFDDYLQTQSINFTSTDKITAIAAFKKLSDLAVGSLFSFSTTPISLDGTFELYAPQVANGTGFAIYQRGTSTRSAVTTSADFKAPSSIVLASKSNIAENSLIVTANKQSISATGTSGTGNFGNYPLFLGMRGGASLPFNGELYALLVIDRILTEAETKTIEKEFGKLMGVTL